MSRLPFLVSIFVLICSAFLSPRIAESEVPQFALTFNRGSEKTYRVCLIGKFPRAKTFNLLSQTNSSVTFNFTETALTNAAFGKYPAKTPDVTLCPSSHAISPTRNHLRSTNIVSSLRTPLYFHPREIGRASQGEFGIVG